MRKMIRTLNNDQEDCENRKKVQEIKETSQM